MTTPFFAKFHNFNQTVWVMLIGGFLAKTTYFMSWPFLIVTMNQKLATSPAAVGFILGVSAFLGAAVGLYVGYLSDKFGRKPVMLTGCVLMMVSFIALIFAERFWHFFVIMSLMGVGLPAVEVVTKAVISDALSRADDREFALQFRYFLINISGALGGLIGLWLGLANPTALFVATAITYVAYFAWISLLIKAGRHHHASQTPNLANALRVMNQDKPFLYLIVANFVLMVVYSQLHAAVPQILALSIPMLAAQFIVMITIVNCGTVVFFQFPLLKLLKKFSIDKRAQIGLAMMLISQFAFIWVVDVHSMLVWGLMFFVFSLGETVVFPTINVNIDQMATDNLRGSYFGAANLSSLGSSAGAMIGGLVIGQWGNAAYFVLTTMLCGLCIAIYHKVALSK